MTTTPRHRLLRILFLCTGNSARSQIAEAILNRKGAGRFEAHSAGSEPAERVHPFAIRALHEAGLEWRGHAPRGIVGLERAAFDDALRLVGRRIDLMLALPVEKLERLVLETRMRAIGDVGAEIPAEGTAS